MAPADDKTSTHVGITGTRTGCNREQLDELTRVLTDLYEPGAWFHHGDCVGVDAQAHDIATTIGYRTVTHPPTNTRYQAHCQAPVNHPPRDYAERNRDIVALSNTLIVVPEGSEFDKPRSGTWQTYRIARKESVPVVLIRGGRW